MILILFDGRHKVYKGNLHAHSTVSDGKLTPDEVVELYRSHGYDFLAITDHRKLAKPCGAYADITLLNGVEFDFQLPAQTIHLLGIGITEEVVANHRKEAGPQRAIDEIKACGGFAVLAHPSWSFNTPATMLALRNVDASEVYNSVSGLPWNADRADSSVLLDICAANGKLFNLVAGDDSHWYNGEHCRAYTVAEAESGSAAHIMSALAAGRFYASTGAGIKLLERCGSVFHIVTDSPAKWIWASSDAVYNAKRVCRVEGATEFDYDAANDCYVRFTVENEDGSRAWTSPVRV